jgi:hypothetical protein
MKKIIIILILISSRTIYAQMASASIFPTMKSVNPATLGNRPQGQLTVSLSKDEIDKKYDLLSGDIGKANIEIDNKSFYYGGKGNSFLNFEAFIFDSSGDRKTSLQSGGVYSEDVINNISFSYNEISMSVGKYLGVSYATKEYQDTTNFNFSFDGQTFQDEYTRDLEGGVYKLGLVLPFKVIRVAVNYESSDIDTYNTTNNPVYYPEGPGFIKTTIIGAAIGITTKKIHLEAGYEMSSTRTVMNPLYDPDPAFQHPAEDETLKSSRISATAEMVWGKLLLGYTMRLYRDGFQDTENLIFNELAFTDEAGNDRTEQIFNFGWGRTKGFTIGGSASISKTETKELFPLYNPVNGKFDTEIEQKSIALNVGYVW